MRLHVARPLAELDRARGSCSLPPAVSCLFWTECGSACWRASRAPLKQKPVRPSAGNRSSTSAINRCCINTSGAERTARRLQDASNGQFLVRRGRDAAAAFVSFVVSRAIENNKLTLSLFFFPFVSLREGCRRARLRRKRLDALSYSRSFVVTE